MSARSVVVGTTEITAHEIGLEAQYHPSESWEQAYHSAERALVLRELLLLECVERGIVPARPSDERATQTAVSELLQSELPATVVADADCRAFYDAHPEKFVAESLYDVSHILLGATPSDPTSFDVARASAHDLRVELMSHPELFERRARERSACPSAGSGGRLGQVSPGETEPDFEAALRELEPGEISGVVETRHGCHLLRLEARAEPKRLPFELVRPKIGAFVEEQRFKRALHAFVLRLAAKHGVVGFDLLSDAPEATPAPTAPAAPRRLRVLSS
jgi:peptidyl-prolyl cis-trans isomerase C